MFWRNVAVGGASSMPMMQSGGMPSFDGDNGALFLWLERQTNGRLCGVSDISYDAEINILYATASRYVIRASRSGAGFRVYLFSIIGRNTLYIALANDQLVRISNPSL